jgi:hypothetical protein
MRIYYYIIVLFISITGCMPPSIYLQPDTQIDSGFFTVQSPAGDWWVYNINSDYGAVKFIDDGYERMGISDTYLKRGNYIAVSVFRVSFDPAKFSDTTEEGIFTEYYSGIERSNEYQYARTNYFKTDVFKKDTLYLNGKHYFRVNYNLARCKVSDAEPVDGYGKLLFYFPEDYLNQAVFYLFQREEYFTHAALQDSTKNNRPEYQVLEDDIRHVLSSFVRR